MLGIKKLKLKLKKNSKVVRGRQELLFETKCVEFKIIYELIEN